MCVSGVCWEKDVYVRVVCVCVFCVVARVSAPTDT